MQVRIYDLASCSLCCAIAAHARWINALEVHPTRDDLFVSAAEDTTVGVWSIAEPSGKVCVCVLWHARACMARTRNNNMHMLYMSTCA